MPKIQIITENDGGGDEPVFASFDLDAARRKYLRMVKACGKVVPDFKPAPSQLSDVEGVPHAETGDRLCVQIGEDWYDIRDHYGDLMVKWFELPVRKPR